MHDRNTSSSSFSGVVISSNHEKGLYHFGYGLVSDKQFIQTTIGSDINVYEYNGDPSSVEIIYACNSRCKTVATIGSDRTWKALEVFGVTIQGNTLLNLANDLTYTDSSTGRKNHLAVNRQGLCLVFVGSNTIKRLRINDHFGWSRYGVKPPTRTMWSVCDMSNGVVLSDRGEERTDCNKCCCTCDGSKNALLMKEVASLKAALRVLTE